MTFICGRAGVYALGAVLAKHASDKRLLDRYLTQFKEVTYCYFFFLFKIYVFLTLVGVQTIYFNLIFFPFLAGLEE